MLNWWFDIVFIFDFYLLFVLYYLFIIIFVGIYLFVFGWLYYGSINISEHTLIPNVPRKKIHFL